MNVGKTNVQQIKLLVFIGNIIDGLEVALGTQCPHMFPVTVFFGCTICHKGEPTGMIKFKEA